MTSVFSKCFSKLEFLVYNFFIYKLNNIFTIEIFVTELILKCIIYYIRWISTMLRNSFFFQFYSCNGEYSFQNVNKNRISVARYKILVMLGYSFSLRIHENNN